MKASIYNKLAALSERHEELSVLLGTPEIINEQAKFRAMSKEYSELEPVAQCFGQYSQAEQAIKDAELMAQENDAELREMAEQEIRALREQLAQTELELQKLLLPKDPNDGRNIYLEIRAGTGGDEAAIFAGDLFRMYSRYAERRGWQIELISENIGEHGGYREVIGRIAGRDVYSRLKFESGAHRVQRVPETESQGRVHTSACTVAILPEVDEVDAIEINPADLRVDTFRASGAGGQHINKTDSAIRITHLPTGTVVECQDERSQHKNRAKAMSVLASRLLAVEQEKQQSAQAQDRRLQVGTGDRSERIRTYNYPQGRLTDHRINLTLYRLGDVMEGDLDEILNSLANEYQADQLASLGDQD